MNSLETKTIEELKAGITYSNEEINEIVEAIKKKYPNTSIKRVCAYGRVSTKHEEQETSLLTQHEVFKNYCERHQNEGYVLVNEVYEQRSGTVTSKRKVFLQIVEEARQGEYDILLFKSSSRFSRNRNDFVDLIEDLQREGIYLVFIREDINTKTADRNTLTLLGMLAESYSNSLHDSVSKAIEVRQNSTLGRVPGNVFGYKRHKDNTSLADIIPYQAELLNELFNRYANGEGIASICRDWQERGIKTYNGGTMSMFALRRYIRNPLYKGILEMGKFTKHDVRADRVRTPDEDLIIRERPDLVIIDPELWDKCNAIMDSNKMELVERSGLCKKQTDIIKDKLFSRVIKCGECGRYYNRKVSNHRDENRKYIYLMCGYKKYNKLNQAGSTVCHNEEVIRLDTLTEIIGLYIRDLINNQENLKEIVVKKITCIIEERKKGLIDKESEERLKEAQAKLKRVVNLYKDGLVDEGEYREQRAVVKQLEQEVKSSKLSGITREEIGQLADKFIQNLEEIIMNNLSDDSGLDVKKFNSMFENIIVYKDHVDIIFKGFNDKDKRLYFLKDNKMDIKEVLTTEHKNLKFICPIVDNEITDCQPLDKLVPYSLEERKFLDSIEDKTERYRIRKKLHRKKKIANRYSVRTSEIMGLSRDAVINNHTNQIVKGLRDVDINLYII